MTMWVCSLSRKREGMEWNGMKGKGEGREGRKRKTVPCMPKTAEILTIPEQRKYTVEPRCSKY